MIKVWSLLDTCINKDDFIISIYMRDGDDKILIYRTSYNYWESPYINENYIDFDYMNCIVVWWEMIDNIGGNILNIFI